MSTSTTGGKRVRPTDLGSDFYVPTFEVTLKNKDLEDTVLRDVISVTYHDSVDDLDSVELVLSNWDADTRDFKYSDGRLFEPGGEIELRMGYRDDSGTKPMISAEIVGLRPAFPNGGQPTVCVTAVNVLHKLRGKQETHTYKNRRDSEIAQDVGRRLKRSFSVDMRIDREAMQNEEPYGYILQKNQYDIVFLMQRARIAGYDLHIEAPKGRDPKALETVVFGPSEATKRVAYELDYGLGPHTGRSPGASQAPASPSLMQFTPTLDTSAQVGSVTVYGFDPVRKKTIKKSVKRSQLKSNALTREGGKERIEKSFEQREEIVNDRAVKTDAEAEALARRTLERISKGMLKASGQTVGLPDLRAGVVVHVTGVGTRFSGRYFVTSTTHTIGDGGYTTGFDCRREEV